MKVDLKNKTIQVNGFDLDGIILVSSADEVTYLNDETGEHEEAEEVKVIIQIEDIKSWIEDYGILNEIEEIKLQNKTKENSNGK